MDKITRFTIDLFEILHPGQPWRTINLDDWRLSGSLAARKVADVAEFVGCMPMDLVNSARTLIDADQAEYDALE